MRRFAETCEAVAATTQKSEKVSLVGTYLRSLPLDAAAGAAVFLAGRAFPRIVRLRPDKPVTEIERSCSSARAVGAGKAASAVPILSS